MPHPPPQLPPGPIFVPASPEPLPRNPLLLGRWPQAPASHWVAPETPWGSSHPPPPSSDDLRPLVPRPCGDPARRRHLSVPAVTLAHRPQIHVGCTAAQVTQVAGPLGQSPERHVDARDGAVGHVTQRRPAPGSGVFGTSSSVQSLPPGRKMCQSPCPETLSPRSQWEPRVGGGSQALGLYWSEFSGARPMTARTEEASGQWAAPLGAGAGRQGNSVTAANMHVEVC